MRFRQSDGNDRGAVLVHVAVALLGLIAFTTFVVDYGVLWASRRQAQNSADAAALAGAMAYAADPLLDKTETGDAKVNAFAISQKNFVWAAAPSVIPKDDITFPTCPDGAPDGCVKVDVYRTVDRGNPLPMFFGPLVGLVQQNIRATATAQVKAGNASECMKPWAIPDKWLEVGTPDYDPTDTFDRYDKDGNVIVDPDVYTPPTKDDPGTGFTVKDDYGKEITLKHGDPQESIRPGWFFPVIIDPECTAKETGGGKGGEGGACYRAAISGCAPVTWAIGDLIETEPGNMVGPTDQGVKDLIDLDPGAEWDDTQNKVVNSCVDLGTCPAYTQSPRIVPIPIFDPDYYQTNKTEGRTWVKVVNILGFFVDDAVVGEKGGKDVMGYLVTQPSTFISGKGEVGWESAFSRIFILVR
jgi:hypothetical protein